MNTYGGVVLGHPLHEADVEGVDSWLSDLLLVLVEPEVVRSVAPQIQLISIQVVVVHIYLFNYTKGM